MTFDCQESHFPILPMFVGEVQVLMVSLNLHSLSLMLEGLFRPPVEVWVRFLKFYVKCGGTYNFLHF